MCCFTRPVDFVANTRIFARSDRRGGQFLAYQMQYLAAEDLAMILPLPVRLPARETSVRFIALNHDPKFFDRLGNGFPDVTEEVVQRAGIATYPPKAPAFSESRIVAGLASARGAAGGGVLAVHRVGDYEASFVPTLNDFARLDPRFKLPRSTWDKIPLYRDYGFAVFKLRRPSHRARPPAKSSRTIWTRPTAKRYAFRAATAQTNRTQWPSPSRRGCPIPCFFPPSTSTTARCMTGRSSTTRSLCRASAPPIPAASRSGSPAGSCAMTAPAL